MTMSPLTIQQTFDLALQHYKAGRLTEAEGLFRQIIARQPGHLSALQLLGVIANQTGQPDVAVDLIRKALAINPNLPSAHNNLGNILRDKGQVDEAIAAFRRAIALNPNLPEAHNNLGNALKDQGQLDEAIAAYRRAISLRGDYARAYSNLGNALRDKGRFAEAIAACRQAIAIKPDDAEAHNNLGLVLLLGGDFEQGWIEHEWRLRVSNFALRAVSTKPVWDGANLAGRRILLLGEQGLGDMIQFIRYLPLVTGHDGSAVVMCARELHRLFSPIQCVAPDEAPPDHDVQYVLMSLPRLLRTTLETIPAPIPYLRAESSLSSQWRMRLPEEPQRKIGLVWAGRAAHHNDRNRSIAPSLLAPLAAVEGVYYCSLQKGSAEQPPLPQLADWTGDLRDLADTAALINNLDLVITVDTSVAHLAGAMGKPTWVLLPFVPDWRWLLDRGDSPWYPSIRLFRQSRPGDWNGPVAQVVDALRQL
jgi:Flp pilus assembly protein TadD